MIRKDWLLRGCLGLGIIISALTFRQWLASSVLALSLLITLLPLRFPLDRIGQIIFALLSLSISYVFTVVIGPPPKHHVFEGMALIRATFCMWALLYSFLRLNIEDPWLGERGTLGLSMMVLLTCGGNQLGTTYHGIACLYTFLALWTFSEIDPSRPTFSVSTKKRKRLLGFATLASSLISIALFISLPLFYSWLTKQMHLSFQGHQQTGFDMYFRLGSIQKMFSSRRIVMRVHGDNQRSLRLRGLVYDRYFDKHWLVSYKVKTKQTNTKTFKESPNPHYVINYTSEEQNRHFLPLRSSNIISEDRHLGIDMMGLFYPSSNAKKIGFSLLQRSQQILSPPRHDDLRVPKHLQTPLKDLARKWTKGVHKTKTKIRMLSERLRKDYLYSLTFSRPTQTDPILDFLYTNKKGHCEYFASSFALLARSLGLPTRVIGGYLAKEYNQIGEYYIVRAKNAHSWVEVWDEQGQWKTVDPTPPGGPNSHMNSEIGTLASIIDLISVKLSQFSEKISSLTLHDLFILIAFFIGIWLIIRFTRYLRDNQKNPDSFKEGYRPVSNVFEEFLSALQNTLPKKGSEPLERYAERIKSYPQKQDSFSSASFILWNYIFWRYGKIGDPKQVEEDMFEWLTKYTKKKEKCRGDTRMK